MRLAEGALHRRDEAITKTRLGSTAFLNKLATHLRRHTALGNFFSSGAWGYTGASYKKRHTPHSRFPPFWRVGTGRAETQD